MFRRSLQLLTLILSFMLSALPALAQIQDQPAARGLNGVQLLCVRSDGGTTTMTSADADWSNCVTDAYGRMITVSGAALGLGDFGAQMGIVPLKVGTDTAETLSTTTTIIATAHGLRVNDYIQFTGGTAANIGLWRKIITVATDSFTIAALAATPANGDAFTAYRSALDTSTYAEDTAFSNGDLVRVMGGVNARSFSAYNSTNGDVTPFSVGDKGVLASMIMYDSSLAGGSSPVVPEDTAISGAQAAVLVGTLMQDPLTIDAASNDLGYNKSDLAGRTVTTLAPSSERFKSCSSSNTGTSDVAIKALVASNKICMTSVSCYNTATVASAISFKSNTTQIYVGGISNSTLAGVGYYEHSMPTPVCTTSGEALNFAMLTNATATTCCAAGFITVD